jgi:hypothetical protein
MPQPYMQMNSQYTNMPLNQMIPQPLTTKQNQPNQITLTNQITLSEPPKSDNEFNSYQSGSNRNENVTL